MKDSQIRILKMSDGTFLFVHVIGEFNTYEDAVDAYLQHSISNESPQEEVLASTTHEMGSVRTTLKWEF